LRQVVLERAGNRCEQCGAEGLVLSLHHKVPRALGGGDDPDNLMAVCWSCHRRLDNELRRAFARGRPFRFGPDPRRSSVRCCG